MHKTDRQDVYTRITGQIVGDLEKGVRPWVKPWNAEHAAGRITRPLRHNGQPYSGINILSLWMSTIPARRGIFQCSIQATQAFRVRPLLGRRARACEPRQRKRCVGTDL
jgi:antirestriction protein ArdC